VGTPDKWFLRQSKVNHQERKAVAVSQDTTIIGEWDWDGQKGGSAPIWVNQNKSEQKESGEGEKQVDG